MRTILALSLLTLGGCPADSMSSCPPGERCSADTPEGLYLGWGSEFAGGERTVQPDSIYVAKGGVDNLEIRDEGALIERPYVVDAVGPAVFVADHGDSHVEVSGAEAGVNYVRVLDPSTGELYDRVKVYSAPIEEIAFDGMDEDVVPPGTPTAFVPGSAVEVLLFGSIDLGDGPVRHQLNDTSMTVSLPGGGDNVNFWTARTGDLSVGTHAINVKAGDRPAHDLPLRIVRDLDAIELQPARGSVIAGREDNLVCFNGLNQGAYVFGFAWSVTYLGREIGGEHYNCVHLDAVSYPVGTVMPLAVKASWRDTVEDVDHSLSAEFEVPVVSSH